MKKNSSNDAMNDPRSYLSGSGIDAGLQKEGYQVISTDLDPRDNERNQERMGRKVDDSFAETGKKAAPECE